MQPWHSIAPSEAAEALDVSLAGLGSAEAAARLARWGPNRLRPPRPPSRWRILLRQFQSPLIYVLIGAAAVALALGEISDAGFIAAVLVLNAAIGFYNEFRAEREVHALHRLIRTRARVRRGGNVVEIDGEDVVPGDVVLLESGVRVTADLRLFESQGLRVDESLLTGESLPVDKDDALALPVDAPLADRRNLAFAGTLVVSGRGIGLVVTTGERTEVGAIASDLGAVERVHPPLLIRMERFARVVGFTAIALCPVIVAIGVARGESVTEMLLAAIALAVSAVPEGLPIALTVALAVAVSQLAGRGVVVRHLPAVEALGSCGVIATDKTGTLTKNELTVERVSAGSEAFEVTGIGYAPEGEILKAGRPVAVAEHPRLFRLLRAAALANEAGLSRREDGDGWAWSGDPTDVALLALAQKGGCDPVMLAELHPIATSIPFEPEHRFTATFHRRDGGGLVCVKGAPERVLEMCATELDEDGGERPLDRGRALETVEDLMRGGYRVLGIADAQTPAAAPSRAAPPEPDALVLLGLVAMTDPPRERVPESVAACQTAGIRVVMITGDHATTARAIAERIGLGASPDAAVTGEAVARLDDEALTARVSDWNIVARASPAEKLRVVQAWQRRGAYVAVTGDGVNDAPALRQANIGVAMGRGGTDVAREAADIVITDDDFSTIVAGVEGGRIAYDNVRKVTYLLVSTGAAEVLFVLAALALGLPLPFSAVQLLWLNLVTNGIQGVALAFEAGEPGTLRRPPLPPQARIFDRMMIERTLLAGLVFAGIGLVAWLDLTDGETPLGHARSWVVQLFVLFEIFHIGNARSETISVFRLSPLRNPVLLAGTLAALGVHVVATYTPFLQRLLGIVPLSLVEWLEIVALAAPIVAVMEAHKWLYRRRAPASAG